MSFEATIKVEALSKCFQIYDHPRERLKQFIFPRAQQLIGIEPKRYFREYWALKNVSFEVRKGETVGIIGQNGSGKSTLLQMICGTLNPTNGAVKTNGRVAALLELGSGFNPEFTGRENVYLNASLFGLSRKETDAQFDEIAAFADIGEFIEQPVKTFSSGMVVRLAFAVAINAQPRILVVDEALSVGDELFQRKCFARIEAIKDRGATILFVSHSGSTIVDLCDRALLLDKGELIGAGSPKTIVAKYQRLLYAPDYKRNLIRQDIARSSLTPSECSSIDPSTQGTFEENTTLSNNSSEEFFDPHLIPQSTVAYESHGAIIQNPKILTLTGKHVNNLIRGKTYRYCYEVIFTQNVTNVRFGMLIKTITGVELGGAASAALREKTIPVVRAGTIGKVEFSFKCILNDGVFFLNAGVLGTLNGDEAYLHRLIDLAMFRVIHEADNLNTCLVDLSPVSDYELICAD